MGRLEDAQQDILAKAQAELESILQKAFWEQGNKTPEQVTAEVEAQVYDYLKEILQRQYGVLDPHIVVVSAGQEIHVSIEGWVWQ